MFLLPGGRFADHSPVRTAVHANPQRAVEAHVPQVGAFVEGLAGVEQILAENAVAAEGVDRQVSYAQRGDVWKKCVPCEGSTSNRSMPHSTITFASEMWVHLTGTPRNGSDDPQRPGPTNI